MQSKKQWNPNAKKPGIKKGGIGEARTRNRSRLKDSKSANMTCEADTTKMPKEVISTVRCVLWSIEEKEVEVDCRRDLKGKGKGLSYCVSVIVIFSYAIVSLLLCSYWRQPWGSKECGPGFLIQERKKKRKRSLATGLVPLEAIRSGNARMLKVCRCNMHANARANVKCAARCIKTADSKKLSGQGDPIYESPNARKMPERHANAKD